MFERNDYVSQIRTTLVFGKQNVSNGLRTLPGMEVQ